MKVLFSYEMRNFNTTPVANTLPWFVHNLDLTSNTLAYLKDAKPQSICSDAFSNAIELLKASELKALRGQE